MAFSSSGVTQNRTSLYPFHGFYQFCVSQSYPCSDSFFLERGIQHLNCLSNSDGDTVLYFLTESHLAHSSIFHCCCLLISSVGHQPVLLRSLVSMGLFYDLSPINYTSNCGKQLTDMDNKDPLYTLAVCTNLSHSYMSCLKASLKQVNFYEAKILWKYER